MILDKLSDKKDIKLYKEVLSSFNMNGTVEADTLLLFRQTCLVIATHHVTCSLMEDGYIVGYNIPELPMSDNPYIDNSICVIEDTNEFMKFTSTMIFDDVTQEQKLYDYLERVIISVYKKFDENSKLNRVINNSLSGGTLNV